MKNNITVIYFDVAGGKTPIKTEIRDELAEYYRLINCDTIDIVARSINDVPVCIVCDDEGRFKKENKITAMNKTMSDFIVGNIIITGRADIEGNLTGLSNEDCLKIGKRMTALSCDIKGLHYGIIFD